ncbi:hypothetical protein NPIL_296991 [Nephila pilipes]|uniref:Uncharacterized protein n=1 Tax=Nephila pilipes TaxID=299642 RepID=A0A8X6PQZ6_NEPPI|nr:hypothetical protein NPIL_296991 [Nephila pilipes]
MDWLAILSCRELIVASLLQFQVDHSSSILSTTQPKHYVEALASLSQLAPYRVDQSIKNRRGDEFWVPIATKSHRSLLTVDSGVPVMMGSC